MKKRVAVSKGEVSKPQARFLGLPGTMKWPGWPAIWKNVWNTDDDATFMPPKAYGYGWSLNFGYPLIVTKPLWKRVLAFVLCLVLIMCLIWALVSVCLIVYYLLTPDPNVIHISI